MASTRWGPVEVFAGAGTTVVCLPAWLLGLLAVLLAGGGAYRRWLRERQQDGP